VQLIGDVETERLIGRRPREEDEAAWIAFWTDSRIDEEAWPADLRTAQDARDVLRATLAHWDRWGFGAWSAVERGTGGVVGRVGLQHTVATGAPEVEVAWFISPDAGGRGLATELAAEAVRVAFEVLELEELVAMTTPANAPSQAVMRKLGFTPAGRVERAGLTHVVSRLRRPDLAASR
jgi:RimJ/RimL family protein N-acetyltransferase